MSVNILCIDDIEINIFTIKNVLQSDKDVKYNIFTALSAYEGLDILIKYKIDLILLDVMMPEIDGFTAAKMIKSNKRTRDIPIIFVTAKKDDVTIEKCYEVGGRDYITKPFNTTELLKRVELHLRLKDKEKLLKNEKEYVQNILDLQDSMIFVTDGTQVIKVNEAILNFFNKKSLFEIQKEYSCICNSFEIEDGYFHLDIIDHNELWVDKILKDLSDKKDVIVKIKNYLSESYVFTVKATKFHEYYILTFTDITAISKQSKEFEYGANYDALTQIYNRKAFERLLNEKIDKQRYIKSKFIFIMLDIDFFKKVNDTYGHQIGDEVLKQLVNVVNSHIRDDDIFARIGGEEFVLILDINIENGFKVINHLREFIENEEFDTVKNITCSFGITEYKKDDSIESMMKRADKALYDAKDSGRNKVCQEL